MPSITTRVYPVDFSRIRGHLSKDLASGFDYAIHLGQAPGYTAVTLEAVGVNVAVERGQAPEKGVPLVPDGPAAYQSQLPLAAWAAGLLGVGIPATVSYHAGTYLCNAALYLSRHECDVRGLETQSAFVHLPMATELVLGRRPHVASLPLATITDAVHWILTSLPPTGREARLET
jgi:pyroglutamyl-peptidase